MKFYQKRILLYGFLFIILFFTLLIASYIISFRYDIPIPFFSKRGEYHAPLLEHTRGIFSFSGASDSLRFIRAEIKPVKVSVGDTQNFSITLKDNDGVRRVTAITELDTHTIRLPLQPIGNSAPGCTECTWQGSWVVNDTISKIYRTTFLAENNLAKIRKITLAWSDPCSPPRGGDWTLDANCTIAETTGLDQGRFTVSAGNTITIQAGGMWIFNQGYSISINQGGVIVLEDGAQINRTLLWVKDSDGDNYPDDTAVRIGQDTQPTDYIRSFSAQSASDCYDSNASANPGQTGWFSSDRGDGSFDYDCSLSVEARWTQTTICSCPKACSSGIGWDTSAPGCGGTKTWYTNTTCGTSSRTQQCH